MDRTSSRHRPSNASAGAQGEDEGKDDQHGRTTSKRRRQQHRDGEVSSATASPPRAPPSQLPSQPPRWITQPQRQSVQQAPLHLGSAVAGANQAATASSDAATAVLASLLLNIDAERSHGNAGLRAADHHGLLNSLLLADAGRREPWLQQPRLLPSSPSHEDPNHLVQALLLGRRVPESAAAAAVPAAASLLFHSHPYVPPTPLDRGLLAAAMSNNHPAGALASVGSQWLPPLSLSSSTSTIPPSTMAQLLGLSSTFGVNPGAQASNFGQYGLGVLNGSGSEVGIGIDLGAQHRHQPQAQGSAADLLSRALLPSLRAPPSLHPTAPTATMSSQSVLDDLLGAGAGAGRRFPFDYWQDGSSGSSGPPARTSQGYGEGTHDASSSSSFHPRVVRHDATRREFAEAGRGSLTLPPSRGHGDGMAATSLTSGVGTAGQDESATAALPTATVDAALVRVESGRADAEASAVARRKPTPHVGPAAEPESDSVAVADRRRTQSGAAVQQGPRTAAVPSIAAGLKKDDDDNNDEDFVGRVVPMSTADDVKFASKYQCLLRKQIEYFEADSQALNVKAQGRNVPIRLGQVGIRCAHCFKTGGENPSSSRPNEGEAIPMIRGAVYYPAKVESLYQAVQNMANNHFADSTCSNIDKRVLEDIQEARRTRPKRSGGKGKKYFSQSAEMLGIVNDPDEGSSGIIMLRKKVGRTTRPDVV